MEIFARLTKDGGGSGSGGRSTKTHDSKDMILEPRGLSQAPPTQPQPALPLGIPDRKITEVEEGREKEGQQKDESEEGRAGEGGCQCRT
ncbi:hypothetical protein L211DRAFT_209206 [Terfezia boudieri ATCC MYA-4762]|uniref:Uncharacterized protein n=1 Tax=Terfezia boudieri ATCC MYA-4762 TaxID=1051890 RepID=A0A3N4LMI4_9PEZI|nr:hypothetical protein L211DRAFT_209206 [Terfezia boudieri ATCC MYA-4762]